MIFQGWGKDAESFQQYQARKQKELREAITRNYWQGAIEVHDQASANNRQWNEIDLDECDDSELPPNLFDLHESALLNLARAKGAFDEAAKLKAKAPVGPIANFLQSMKAQALRNVGKPVIV
jgi:hypothetical protein